MTSPYVILLFNGKRKSGKDYLCGKLKSLLGSEKCSVLRISEPLKRIYAKDHNLDLEELLSDSPYKEVHRYNMIKWSEEIREKEPGIFCKAACESANTTSIWIVSDIRRKTDISWFKDNYGNLIKTIRISADVEISLEDEIPSLICGKCLNFINKIDDFFETIRKSEKVLFKLYNSKPNTAQSNRNVPDNKADNIKYTNSEFNNSTNSNGILVTRELVQYVAPPLASPVESLDEDCDSDVSKIVFEKTDRKLSEDTNSITKLYTCDICFQVFDNFFDYQDHQESHNGQFVFKCSKCDEVFSTRKDIVTHENNHKVSCLICQMKVLPKSLEAHMKKHTDIFKCNKCDSRHCSRAALETHIKARHAGMKGYVCHICGKQNSCQASMTRHLATHLLNRPFKCKSCNFATKSKTTLKVHISRRHLNQACTCEICKKLFKSNLSLQQHKKRIHDPKKYVCATCGKFFSEKFNLTNHAKKHANKRVYECKICRQEFFTTKNLKDHMHSHRSGCVNCSSCGKVFTYKKYLEKHSMQCNEGSGKVSDCNVFVLKEENKINKK